MSEKEKLPEAEETGVLEHETPPETADVPERETSPDAVEETERKPSRLWNWRLLKHKKPTDPYEEMRNDMIRRTLAGEIIPFDEYLDAEDELSGEPDAPPPSEEEIREASNARERFLSEARRFGLPVENRFMLTQTLCEKARAEPSQALLRLACYILCDTGVLLDMDPESHSPEEDVAGWQIVREDAEELYTQLSARKRMSAQFGELLERLKKIRPAGGLSGNPETSEEQVLIIGQAYSETFPLWEENVEQLCGNISILLNVAKSNSDIAAVKPLFLYRVLTRHGKRLQTAADLRPDFRALWKYKHYKIDDDNGKNYRTYAQYLYLFEVLYDLFAADESVDAPLCLYGFDHLSNLGDYYRLYPEEQQTLPFSLSIEELLLKLECAFTCFEHGYGDNAILEEYGISVRKLEKFQCSTDRKIQKAFEKIDRYLDANAVGLLTRFLEEPAPAQVKQLCAEILDKSELPDKLRPKDEKQTALFLAAINQVLMETADSCAEENLVKACKLLTGDRVE